MAQAPKEHRASAETVHQYLSTKRVKELGFRAGLLYQQVVETLLTFNFTHNGDDETLTREFFQKVLYQLIMISVD